MQPKNLTARWEALAEEDPRACLKAMAADLMGATEDELGLVETEIRLFLAIRVERAASLARCARLGPDPNDCSPELEELRAERHRLEAACQARAETTPEETAMATKRDELRVRLSAAQGGAGEWRRKLETARKELEGVPT